MHVFDYTGQLQNMFQLITGSKVEFLLQIH